MKNRLLAILFLFIFFVSCNNKKENENLLLFNNITFTTEANEHILKIITPNIKNKFQSYFSQSSFQIPLFKCVQSTDYIIYIGLPYHTSVSELINSSMAQQDSLSVFNSDSQTYYYKRWKINEIFLSEYLVNCKNNLIYLLVETTNDTVADSLFNFEKLSKRLVYENK